MKEMNCDEIYAKLSGYLSGELDGDLCKAIAAHLERCRPCHGEHELMKLADECAREAPVESVAPREWRSVWKGVKAEVLAPKKRTVPWREVIKRAYARPIVRWAPALAALFIAAVVGVWIVATPRSNGLIQLAHGDEIEIEDITVDDPAYTSIYYVEVESDTPVVWFVERDDEKAL